MKLISVLNQMEGPLLNPSLIAETAFPQSDDERERAAVYHNRFRLRLQLYRKLGQTAGARHPSGALTPDGYVVRDGQSPLPAWRRERWLELAELEVTAVRQPSS